MTDPELIRLYRRGLTLKAIAKRLGVPSWASVQRRVQALMKRGELDYGKRTRRPWTAETEAELRGLAGWYQPEEIARRLGRSTTAIRVKMKRLGLSRQWKGAYTARDVGRIFRVDSGSVRIWIDRGFLKASRSDVRCGGARKWWIEHEAIEAFIREHPDFYERRRITAPRGVVVLAALPG